MDTLNLWLFPAWALMLPIALAFPLGWFMWRMLDVSETRTGRGADAIPMALLRLLGRRRPAEMDWRRYAASMLAFHVALFAVTFLLLTFQDRLPLNPDSKGPFSRLGYKDAAGVDQPGADTAVVFNTVCSFVTNTNLQHYSGEQHLSYASQLGGIVWLQFVTPAAGLAVMLATLRGLRGDRHLGDFYLDELRGILFILLPASVLMAIPLMAGGVPMTFEGAAQVTTLEGQSQTIARGPVAAELAIKQLGTNGGGYFGPNSAHPFENPNGWTCLMEVVAIPLIPMASMVMAGLMLRNLRHALVLSGVMLAFLVTGVAIAIDQERATGPGEATAMSLVAPGPNVEGKEVRFGPAATATWAAFTTATSNGSVNGMHDSFRPLGGLVPLSLMMLNVVFSGIGAGFENMLMYVVIAVFIAGLMVGRTPEYLGKKVEAREVKFAMVAVLIHPLLICAGTALFAATSWSAFCANPGPHGFSEILYEFTSAAANNGSGFEGLSDNNPAWNIATGIVLLLGRFPALILPLALAGSLAAKKRVPETTGTLRTDNLTFAGMLLGTVVLVGALSFLPALVLGPVADHLTKAAQTTTN